MNVLHRRINNFFRFSLKSIFILSFIFIFITLSVYFTLLFKPLYYIDINVLNIEQSTNLNKNELKSNYDYVITYLTQNKTEEFNLPTLPSSQHGKIHFKEVKIIFDRLKVMLLCSVIISIIGIIINKRYKKTKYLLTSSIFLIILPVLLLIPFLIDFDKSFTTFHHIFFNNDYWLFDVDLDPIITILPQTFFFHCAILVIILISISSIMLRCIYKSSLKNNQ
ncbi:TIGR01906 family membrane protein [Clostridium lacusfryxellense]|uniref:TIGR01906 family membrane protein n=1 Tax=Clostridium lacusfryxellense TaxID=205328 RepID=UPI001C0E0E72|nr:TIGR01906 family membrane protein [Clostridium lacusfryxellense]MBU3114331.1 TIGR01906 family membrane protein [Clostridium lacusfryxellense]